jgi:8-oxo-dGTP pyrophosphatase MutT (NUDIX family)
MKRHFCASIFIVDPKTKKILLVKHKKFNKWVQPGGHMEENETPEETALREAYEETGLRIDLVGERFPRESDFIKPLGVQKNTNDKGDLHIDFIYVGIPREEHYEKFDKDESYAIKWFSRDELEHYDVFPDIKITFDYILKNIVR